MSEIKDGGSAFPTGIITNDKGVIVGGSNGMALRDYFAAKAMQSFIGVYSHEGDISRNAYKVADAMLKARGQK